MFGLLSKKPRADVGAVGGFGKVPALGDFVRTQSPCDEMIAFEGWLTRALETAEARPGSAFKDGFAGARPHAFVWSGTIEKKLRGLFAGVVLTSHDAVGRRFPLVIGAPLPPAVLAAQPHTAPLLLDLFFHHASAAATRARQTRSAVEFHAEVMSIAPPSLDDAAGSLATYTTWTKAQRASDTWAGLYGDDASRASIHALGILVDATSAYRGQDLPPLTLGVRVPLGALGALEAKNIAALWIDLVRSAAGWKTTMPSLFFALDGDPRNALIQLGGEAPSTVLADLFAPSLDSEAVCDLVTADGAPPPPSLRAPVPTDASLADVVLEIGR